MNIYTLDQYEIGYSEAPLVETQDDIVFDGYSLQSTSIITSELNYDDLGNLDLNSFNYPRNNGGGVLNKWYRGRTLTLKATAKASTASAFNTLIDQIKDGLSATEGYLDVRVNTEVRRIKATVTKIDFQRQHYNITFCPFTVTFTALEPFFYAYSPQSFAYVGYTGTFSEEITYYGTADSEPAMYMVFGAGTAVTAISFSNPDGTTLTITTAITVNDILIIDCANKTVTLNGTEIDYTGVFLKMRPGSNPFTVTYTGTVLVDVTLIVPKNYL